MISYIYRLPDATLTQDSVMALGFAVLNRHHAHATPTRGRINRELFYALNDLTPPDRYQRPKLMIGGPALGLVKLNPPPGSDHSPFRADACTGQLEKMLAEGWTVADPADLKKLALEHLLEEQ